MSDYIPSLKPLKEDHDRYQDVFLNGFYKIAKKDLERETILRCFDTEVMNRLTDVFSRNDPFNMLGIGVGEGLHESHFLKSLGSYYPSICNVAVEPNEGLLDKFKSNIATFNSDGTSSIVCHWFTGLLSKFVAESPLAGCKYNLITAIHAMYYTGDLETTFTQLTSLIKDKGIVIIVCNNDDCIFPKTFKDKTYLPANTGVDERVSSNVVRALAQRQGYDVITFSIALNWDITDVFNEKSDLGNKLLDFFTQTAYFRQTAPVGLVDDLMSFWRSISKEAEGGQIQAPAGGEILLISK